jgi:DHA2 family multidrug resistance protein-like MFS transporter
MFVPEEFLMSAHAASRANRKAWIGLAILALPCLLYSMDLTVLNLAVPHLTADLKPTSLQLLWIIDIYGFVLAGSLITMGTLGDRIGRRRLLMIGATAFGVASVLAAYSTSAEMLIAARAVLGLAGATLAPSTLSLIRNMFLDSAQRTVAIGIWVTSYSAGAAIGPLVGGLLLESFWWGSVFLVGVPVMLLLLVLGPTLLPEYRDPEPGRLDIFSVGLSMVSVLAVIYGLKQIAQEGMGGLSVLSVFAGLAGGAEFVRRQQVLADPLIDLRLFRAPAFSAALVTYTLGTFVGFGAFVFVYQYLQFVLGLSPLQAGLWTVPSFGVFIIGSQLVPVITRRVRPGFVMAAGFALSAVGYGLLTRVDGPSGLAVFVVASVVYSFGLVPVFVLATDLIVGSAPPERAGAASAISETGSELGGALGIAALGTLGTAVYRHQMADSVPAGVPPQAAEAARDTLGAAVLAAEQLSDQIGIALRDAAGEAFVQGMQLAATTSALLALGLAVVAAIMLRHVRVGDESEVDEASAPVSTSEEVAALNDRSAHRQVQLCQPATQAQ